MGWLIAAAVLIGIGCIPLGINFRFSAEGIALYGAAGPFRFQILPQRKRKPQKTKKKPSDPEKKITKSSKTSQKADEKGGKITDFLPLVKTGFSFLNDFRQRLVVKNLELTLVLAGGDPCSLALNYGRTWAAIGNLIPHLDRFLDIRKRKICVECDFLGTQTLAACFISVRISLGRLLWLAIRYSIRVFRQFIYIKNIRKGGAKI